MDTVALMGWVAIAKDQQLKQDITVLERSLVFIGSSYSQFGYDSEDTAHAELTSCVRSRNPTPAGTRARRIHGRPDAIVGLQR